jgi:hypothetical protein
VDTNKSNSNLNRRQDLFGELARAPLEHFYSLFAEDSNLLFLAEINAISDMEKTPQQNQKNIINISTCLKSKVQSAMLL